MLDEVLEAHQFLENLVGVAWQQLGRIQIALQVGAGQTQVVGIFRDVVHGTGILDFQMQRRLVLPEDRPIEGGHLHRRVRGEEEPDHLGYSHLAFGHEAPLCDPT